MCCGIYWAPRYSAIPDKIFIVIFDYFQVGRDSITPRNTNISISYPYCSLSYTFLSVWGTSVPVVCLAFKCEWCCCNPQRGREVCLLEQTKLTLRSALKVTDREGGGRSRSSLDTLTFLSPPLGISSIAMVSPGLILAARLQPSTSRVRECARSLGFHQSSRPTRICLKVIFMRNSNYIT